MTTPIVDFIEKYKKTDALRLHTPGHKGKNILGFEGYDITELDGADELFCPSGIIAESEKNASDIFGVPTYYSTEGSSLCIRAMIYLLSQIRGQKPVIIAGRNAHKSFIYAAAMTDADVIFTKPRENDTHLSVTVTAKDVEETIKESEKPASAVFITTPDYPGKMTELSEISAVCKKYDALLLVDCAHGAYLHFTGNSPLSYADICCSSAHKTLPALTGAAYLHVKYPIPATAVKAALAAFASTSPSYLILASLDALNPYLTGHKKRLSEFIPKVDELKSKLKSKSFELYGDEPLKITVNAAKYGYIGDEIAEYLIKNSVYPEYADKEYITFMITPEVEEEGLKRLFDVLSSLPQKQALNVKPVTLITPKRVMSVREAFFSQKEILPTRSCAGRVCSDVNISCPPAVCPISCGELVGEDMIPVLLDIGIKELSVIKNP